MKQAPKKLLNSIVVWILFKASIEFTAAFIGFILLYIFAARFMLYTLDVTRQSGSQEMCLILSMKASYSNLIRILPAVSRTKGCSFFKPLNAKRRPLYLKTQFVPRSTHFFISVIKTNQFML